MPCKKRVFYAANGAFNRLNCMYLTFSEVQVRIKEHIKKPGSWRNAVRKLTKPLQYKKSLVT